MTPAELKQKVEENQRLANSQRAKSLEDWLEKPEVRLVISLIPASPAAPECLKTLLESAFEAGFNTGAAFICADILKSMMEKNP